MEFTVVSEKIQDHAVSTVLMLAYTGMFTGMLLKVEHAWIFPVTNGMMWDNWYLINFIQLLL